MSRRRGEVSETLARHEGQSLDRHYLGYFDCFNRQLYFEAHDVLEPIWLKCRQGPNGSFYKGLIQLAGAFVHLQKQRTGPAAALFKLAASNLKSYGALHERLDLDAVRALIAEWLLRLESGEIENKPLPCEKAPELKLRN